MKTAGRGIARLTPLLLASLLLHLAVVIAVVGFAGWETAERRAAPPLSVDYIEPPAGRERLPERSADQPVPAMPPERRRVVVLTKPLSTTPPVAMAPRNESGGGPFGVGIAPIAPAADGADMRGVRGSGAGSGTGEGSGTRTGAGLYGNGTAGTHGVSATPSALPGALQRRAAFQTLLRRLIEAHKEYPLAARRSRLEGNCIRRFTISRSGTLKKVESLSSCGHEYLDDAATRAIMAVGTFPPLPDEIAGGEATFEIPIKFTLRNE